MKAAPSSLAPAQSTIALLQSSSLTSAVQQELERRIVQGELAPGDKLIEATLAEQLGVSRGPVREAFRMLEEAGLVRQEKNRGAFVRAIPLDEALEIYDLRAIMDEAVGRRLAVSATPSQLRRLRGQVEAMERLVAAGDADAYHLLNLAFHDTLVELAGNRKLTALYRRLINELSLFRRRNLADAAQLPLSADEHRAIVAAIAAGDEQAAGLAMRRHVLDSKERTLRNHAAPQPAHDSAA
ncbi:Phosphonate utilization associated transcriptional regulator [Rubrivivax sp. A210]|uniref:phosphonate utilization associated transcriptional regulator n=1 Tax=Rubrivivax sp. A210 TaxID=2772301 RepID=UPI001917A61A|nr:phosphonate utilization associated transcriptional regulator [Rubrivivax sp. A210]CAD5373454.1 Phosphonate utilization associated transcriptional regulator [Rubrivivax sp. A210]